MAHNVVVGGFASGRKQVEKLASSLATYHDDDFEGISFREAMDDPGRLDRMTRDAHVVTHSAGMVALRDMRPRSIDAIAPPVPVWAPLLAAKAIASTAELAAYSLLPWQEADEVDGCLRNGAEELCLHLQGNMQWLGRIAAFDALTSGLAAKEAGIEVGMAFMGSDLLFQPSNQKITRARQNGLYVVRVPGGHEEFIRHPRRVFAAYEEGGTWESAPSTMPTIPRLAHDS